MEVCLLNKAQTPHIKKVEDSDGHAAEWCLFFLWNIYK